MKCPYCLTVNEYKRSGNTTTAYHCKSCKSLIPRGYVEQAETPRSTVGVVGFSGHGKTVYLTALFSTLSRLSSYWNGYYFRCLDDFTHRILYQQVPAFDKGTLPESTPANFPNPALIHYRELPVYGDSFLAYYDTAGEVFTDSAQIRRGGFFVAHSDTVLFILSLPDLEFSRADEQMSNLLDTYIRAVYDQLNLNLRVQQDIIVILTKSDLLMPQLTEPLANWLRAGTMDNYGISLQEATIDVEIQSAHIAEWLRNTVGATRFINMLNDKFRSVHYCLISATGIVPNAIEPLRVLDPFLILLAQIKYRNRNVQTKIKMLLRSVFKL